MPVSTLHVLSHLILTTTLCGTHSYPSSDRRDVASMDGASLAARRGEGINLAI